MGRQKQQHLKQRADGRFVAVYHGKQFMGRTEEEALAARRAYQENEKRSNQTQTVFEFASKWLPISHPKSSVSDSTYNGLAIHLDKLIKHVGNLPVQAVTPLDIKQVYSQEYDGLSASYIKAGKQLFCALFDAAMENGMCSSNPARQRAAKPHRGTTGGHRAITLQERWWIENLCKDHRAHAAAVVMLYEGLRPQELKALNVDRDVDFENNTLTVRETAHLDGLDYVRTTKGKTAKANRTIPLFAPAREVLLGKHGYLAVSASGRPVNVQAWKNLWASYQTAMETEINGIQKRWYGKTREQMKNPPPPWVEFRVTPYDLRYSFCTACRDAEPPVEINTLIHWMGHSDARMILQVYDQYSEDRGRQEAQKLEKWIGNMQKDMQAARFSTSKQ